jgi:hypothetical protein
MSEAEGGDTQDSSAGGSNTESLQDAVSRASPDNETDPTTEQEVKMLQEEYAAAREFDKEARQAYAADRRYAAGKSDPNWASDANMIGSFIDILVAFLYAQNPAVGCRAAPVVGDQPNAENTSFAQSMELVIRSLWRLGHLKKVARKQVRSSLSVGIGWFKALMATSKRPDPQTEEQMTTMESQLAQIDAEEEMLEDGTENDKDARKQMIEREKEALQQKLELKTKYGMAIDFCRAEDMQVSLDISNLDDYLDADWISNDMYVPQSQIIARCKNITPEDLKIATVFYQRQQPSKGKGDALASATGEPAYEGQFQKTAPGNQAGTVGGSRPIQFCKIVELWDHRDGLIKTFVDGVTKWAIDPFPPPQATSRFYPYFALAFYEVDGERHPQSLPERLKKLQDEYSACRSNQRLCRERSIPGVMFHAGEVDPTEANKLKDSASQELIPIKSTSGSSVPLANLFAAKPVGTYNPQLYDTSPIVNDMERMSGAQEALQQTSSQPKTATEANIQNTGFQTRTGTDRDTLEEMLTDFAHYTSECAIQEIKPVGAQRIGGPKTFWPYGMDVEDLLTMVEIDIAAGTTGKPNAQADKQNWSTFMPMLQQALGHIRMAQAGDPGLATAMINILKETLRRLDDSLDINDFLPQGPPPPPPPPPGPPPPTVSVALKGVLPPEDALAIGDRAAGIAPPVPPGLPSAPGSGAPPPPNVAALLAGGHGTPAKAPTTQPHGAPGGIVIPHQ